MPNIVIACHRAEIGRGVIEGGFLDFDGEFVVLRGQEMQLD